MIAECARDARTVACNCAGTRLHDFLPKTRAPADQLRAAGRLLDLEWDDDDGFVLELAAIARALEEGIEVARRVPESLCTAPMDALCRALACRVYPVACDALDSSIEANECRTVDDQSPVNDVQITLR